MPKDQGMLFTRRSYCERRNWLSIEKRPQGIKKQRTLRRSLRLQKIQQSYKQFLSESSLIQAPPSPPASNIPDGTKVCVLIASISSRSQEQRPSKRLQPSSSSRINKNKSHQTPTTDITESTTEALHHWIKTGEWLKEYFEQDSQVREDFERGKSPEEAGRKDFLQEHCAREPFQKMHAISQLHHSFARKKSSTSLRRKQSQSSIQAPSDQLSQGGRSSQYNNPEYEIRLEQKGSYMCDHDDIDGDDAGDDIKVLCNTLLENNQKIPQDSLFRDDLFKRTCEKIRNRNEAIVVQDVTRLIVPSAENLAIYGAKHLKHLYETVNEAWSSMFEYEGTLPQPDYSVGFARFAFTQEQLNKLKPFVGEPGFKVTTYLMATTRMYFPFLTCEIKCGAAALDFADRQNAQSMSVALRAVVVLFKYVKREKELDREILAFSISHDHRSVRIYGHYPVMEGDKTSFYRHSIRTFDFTEQDGKEKWTAYKFVKNVYDHHSLKLHGMICSAIDDLPPDINFDLSQSASFSQSTLQSSQWSNTESLPGEDDSQLSFLGSQDVTPSTSFTHTNEPAFKKPKNRQAAGQRR